MKLWNNLPKYGNQKVTIGGENFDSRHEYGRWCELQLMQKAGMIKDLRRQVKFVLIPAQRSGGTVVERECAYKADFTYQEKVGLDEWRLVVEDAKGCKTEVYKIKKKLMRFVHGIEVREV